MKLKTTKTLKQIITIFFIGIFLFSCKSNNEVETSLSPNIDCSKCNTVADLNISILLDLSDRIDTVKYNNASMQYYRRDIEAIKNIMSALTNNILCKRTNEVNEKIKIYIEPAPADPNINQILNKTSKTFNRNNNSLDSINDFQLDFLANVENIYKSAMNTSKYVGADIYDFVLDECKSKCLDAEKSNILFIFTDGYLYYNKSVKKPIGNRYNTLIPESSKQLGLNTADWKSKFNNEDYGFFTNAVNLSEFKVAIIGLNIYEGGPYEMEFLKANWEKFLDELGIPDSNQLILKTDLPVNFSDQIATFINN